MNLFFLSRTTKGLNNDMDGLCNRLGGTAQCYQTCRKETFGKPSLRRKGSINIDFREVIYIEMVQNGARWSGPCGDDAYIYWLNMIGVLLNRLPHQRF
jgi:hypothetical protein